MQVSAHVRHKITLHITYIIQLTPLGAFQWPITSSVMLTFLPKLVIFTTIEVFTSLAVFILTHPVNFPVGGNRSARRKPTTFGRVLTSSFHMSEALGSSNIEKVLSENRTRSLRGERRALLPLRHRSPLDRGSERLLEHLMNLFQNIIEVCITDTCIRIKVLLKKTHLYFSRNYKSKCACAQGRTLSLNISGCMWVRSEMCGSKIM